MRRPSDSGCPFDMIFYSADDASPAPSVPLIKLTREEQEEVRATKQQPRRGRTSGTKTVPGT